MCVRFLLNGPKEDLETAERICFRVEEAQWYYEDFIRPLDPTLPSMTLKNFCEAIFAHCPLLSHYSQDYRTSAFDAFLRYKKRVPVRGAIMLNYDMDKVVLVKGWKKSANWGFPRGKINKDEDDLDCAIREVYEETGYDLEEAGFVPQNRQVKSIDLNMHEQQIRLFIFRGIPTNAHFEPRTRKEISVVDWWRLSDLPAYRKGKLQTQQQPVCNPANFYMVAPFLAHVKKWIAEQKKRDFDIQIDGPYITPRLDIGQDEVFNDDDQDADSKSEAISREELSINKNSAQNDAKDRSNPSIDPIQQSGQAPRHSQNLPVNSIGTALLSLLHSNPKDTNQKPHDDRPETPPNHDKVPTYLPQTPHQVSKTPHFPSMPPPSGFSTYEQSEEESFCHKQPPVKKQYEKMIEAQKHIQAQQQNSNSGAHPFQPQHLIHPQPLPPYVQRAIFAQSPVPDSPLYSKVSHLNMTSMSPQSPPTLPIMIPESKKQAPTKLSNHTLALLNSFKSHTNQPTPTISSEKQISARTPESQYSYVDMPSAPTPPMKNVIFDQTERYNDVLNSPWCSVLQQTATEKNIRRTQRQDYELAYPQTSAEKKIPDESNTSKTPAAWKGVLSRESGFPESAPLQNLILQNQNHPWDNRTKSLNPASVYNEQDLINQNISVQNSFCSSESLSQPLSNPQVQATKPYQASREPYQNIKSLVFPRQPQELPASSLSKKQMFATSGLPSNDKDGEHCHNPTLDSGNSLIEKHNYNSLNLKSFNHNSTEILDSSSSRAIPRSKTPSAVELSAVDPSTDNIKLAPTLLDKTSAASHPAPITNYFSESAKLPFGATKILLRPANQENVPNSSLRRGITQSTHFKPSRENLSLSSDHKTPVKESLVFQKGTTKIPSNQSLPSRSDIIPKLESSKPSESSKIHQNKYHQPYHQQNLQPIIGKEGLSQSYHLGTNKLASLSTSDSFLPPSPRASVTDLSVLRKNSQTISPSDKGFLLSYLEAVVAKGANL